MSAQGTVTLVWANGEDQFCIAQVGHIFDLEEKCRAGIGTIVRRLEEGSYYLNDVRETIRLGLIGGGMSAEKAMAAVKRHVDGAPVTVNVMLAYNILIAAMVGVEGDDVGKKKPEAEASLSTETTVAFPDRSFSESAPASDGHHASPNNAPSGSSAPASRATTSPAESRPNPSL